MIKMAFDGIVTSAISEELKSLCGARIDKILEPNKNTIIIGLYLNGKNYALNVCIDARNYRINLTTHSSPNPQVAPNFCMVLRKHLYGMHLKNIITSNLERIIILEFEGLDEIEDIFNKKIIVELMGKHSNIILLDENNIIIDSIRHISTDSESFRNILPHFKYIAPSTSKSNFLNITNFNDFKAKLVLGNPNKLDTSTLPSNISNIFNGISKSFIENIIKYLNITTINEDTLKSIYLYIKDILQRIDSHTLEFKLVNSSNNINKDFYLAPTNTQVMPFALNFFIDDFYEQKETNEQFKNYRNSMLKLILDVLKKYNKRLENMDKKLEECKNMDMFKLYGELITANLYKIKNINMDSIDLENYYDNNKIVTIPLDKKYNPSVNAKRYFKKYNKLKNTLEIVSNQKYETLKDLDYLESVIFELENSYSVSDISNIFEEIMENEIFKEKTKKYQNNKNYKIKKSKLTKNKTVSFNPIKYTVNGYTVLVGRNNKENDYLTLKYSNKNDIWFHVKDIQGSHVILRLENKNIPNNDILLNCAKIAAIHSKAKNSSNVLVDYCQVKFVKKPNGAKPGMVIYTNNKTLNVINLL